jgi:hypothetical protein
MDVEQLRGAQQTGTLSAFRVVRALLDRPPRVWFVTRHVHRVLDGDRAEGLAAAPLVGLTRVANNETQCSFSLVDLEVCSVDEAAERRGRDHGCTGWRAGGRINGTATAATRRTHADHCRRRSMPCGTGRSRRIVQIGPRGAHDLALHET